MRGPLYITERVVVPERAMLVHAVRASGPGGQNVNKVSSKVELRVDLSQITGLDAWQRERLRQRAATHVDSEGWLLVTSQKTRDQPRNLDDAREKVAELVRSCLARPKVRHKTKPTRGSQERRLTAKRIQSQRKRSRRGDDD